MTAAQKSIIWTVQAAIAKQVEVEDLMLWGSMGVDVIPELAPIPDSKPNRTSAVAFIRGCLP